MHVLMLQLPVPDNPATNVPLAAGYLKAYAQACGLLERVQIDIMPRALADHAGDAALVDAIVARRPDVLAVSLYTWNSERTLDIARRARERLPDLLVVAGGPEVQRDNPWVLDHPGLDIGVIGEGEQTFAQLLELLYSQHAREKGTPVVAENLPRTPPSSVQRIHFHSAWGPGAESSLSPVGEERGVRESWRTYLKEIGAHSALETVTGLVFRNADGALMFTPERVPLPELAVVPSPYLLGYLEIDPGALLMVEVSRWCPYACSFCLYGRNMGPRLGGRSFGLERLLAEIRWGVERGVTRVHFIEANLNLVPVFRSLMAALAELNADGRLALYAELRGEHLGVDVVALLARAGLRVAEVGLQTANPAALRATQRRTDLQKWAAGTRRLYAAGVDVLLDVILGLPADDSAGVAETLDFIQREKLGPYDAFTLQVLPGVAVRRQAAEYGLVFQERPPYYVLATDRLDYAELRSLRRTLKQGTGLEADAVEGCPEPRFDALASLSGAPLRSRGSAQLVTHIAQGALASPETVDSLSQRLASHVDIIAGWEDLQRSAFSVQRFVTYNPSTLFDLYLLAETPPTPADLRAFRDALPFQPGYLDRVAVYRREQPEPAYERVSPRLFLIVPWNVPLEPGDYAGVAQIIWEYRLAANEPAPLAAWSAAGGAGVWVPDATPAQMAAWREQTPLRLWGGA
jgi:radical SAM superfamily enzyme YgiQ (UPF0313 family)